MGGSYEDLYRQTRRSDLETIIRERQDALRGRPLHWHERLLLAAWVALIWIVIGRIIWRLAFG